MGSRYKTATFLLAAMLCMVATSLSAETYRWKDKDGKTHYGAAVPAEYADQPYDVLNNAGMVIDRIEDTSVPMDIREEEKKIIKERAPLISQEERDRQYDRLLVIQYRSEDEIKQAMELELAQLDYDKTIIAQSFTSTSHAIRDQIDQAADQQRANRPIKEDQQRAIDRLYARLDSDTSKQLAMDRRESQIRERYQKHLDRYRFLTSGGEEGKGEQTDQD